MPPRNARTLTRGLGAALLLSAAATRASGDAVHGVHVLAARVIAPRGGVLMVPLGAERAGDEWPASLELVFADGASTEGTVVWVHPRPLDPLVARRWTDEPSGLAVRAIEPQDDTSMSGASTPYLVARMPADGIGSIRVGDQVLAADWRDPNAAYTFTPLPDFDRPELPRIESPARPDPDSPFEYWRWVLLADRLEQRPPPSSSYGWPASLVAEHYAALWRIGLARLAGVSLSVAESCRNVLTRIGADPPDRFAAWVADPAELQRLLSALIDFETSDDDVLAAVVAWIEARAPLATWSESETQSDVSLAIISRSVLPIVARLAWESAETEPTVVEVPPDGLTRASVPRAPRDPRDPLGRVEPREPLIEILTVRAGLESQQLAFGPPSLMVKPPGAQLPPLRPSLTLAELDAQTVRPMDPAYATIAHVRRLFDRWELFVDCRRPPGANGAAERADDPLSAFERAEDVRGVEAVTLLLGPADAPTAVLAVPEQGAFRLFESASSGALEVHRASYVDRWYCRIILPSEWLAPGASTFIGCRRAHAGGGAVEATPHASVPWRPAHGRIALDLSKWDE